MNWRTISRGAVVYAQFKDLPTAIKRWDESAMKERYLKSVNYQKLWSRHLTNKLFSRWEKFNATAGFSLGASAFSAIAVYDIGRLGLVVIAPLSEAKFAATRFFQHKGSFEGIEAPGGTLYYLIDVEADNGRQKRQIGFAQDLPDINVDWLSQSDNFVCPKSHHRRALTRSSGTN